MTFPISPDDRPDPSEQHAVRARVPDHVARGVFSTGVIVMTAPTEFVIDFIQNLGRPHQIVARVVMPHPVMPQFVDALLKNIELYRARYGNLPTPNISGMMITNASGSVPVPNSPPPPSPPKAPPSAPNPAGQTPANWGEPPTNPGVGPQIAPGQGTSPGTSQGTGQGGMGSTENAGGPASPGQRGGPSGAGYSGPGQGYGPIDVGPGQALPGSGAGPGFPPGTAGQGFLPQEPGPQVPPQNLRRASAQEIYDDLKMRDEILSGSYANAVMIGHGPHEFSFDFITNFYPHSAVSARVFLAAGQVARLADSLRGAWDQIRHRFQPPPGQDGTTGY